MAESLDDPALDLAASAERVDDPADVVDRRDPADAHLAGADVDCDLRHLHAEREHSHPGRIRAARARSEDLRVLEQPEQALERPGAAVRADDPAALQRKSALLLLPALRRELEDLAASVACGGAHGRAHRGDRRGAGGDRRERPSGGVAELDPHLRERHAELLRGDLRHRGARARADVLHRRDDGHARVGADAHPGIRRRPAAAVPDLAREPDAVLPRLVGAGAHLVAPLPVGLGPAVALEQALRGEGPPVEHVQVGVVPPPQLERVEPELRAELVEQALEPERPLDEPRRAKRGHRGRVQLGAVQSRRHVRDAVEHLHRAVRAGDPAVPADGVHELAAERRRSCRRSALRFADVGSSRSGCPRRGSPRAA